MDGRESEKSRLHSIQRRQEVGRDIKLWGESVKETSDFNDMSSSWTTGSQYATAM